MSIMKEYKHIIVRMPNWLGDLVMATPILEDLRKKFPASEIVAMCQGFSGDLICHDPHVNEIFAFKKLSGWVHQANPESIIAPLKKGDFDLGVLLTHSFSSAYQFWRGGVKNRIGFSIHGRSPFLTKAIPLPKNIEEQHHVVTYKEILASIDIPISQTAPKLYLTQEEINLARNTLSIATDKVIGINPGAAYGSSKCWPPDRFRSLVEKILKETAFTVVLFGDDSLKSIVDQISHGLGEKVVNMAGKTTLRELMALIKSCSVFVSNDSGPMHMAAALGVPLVALFGSTNPTKTGPYNHGKVIYKKVFCSPCYRRTCPIDFQCMLKIEVDEVFNAMMEQL